MRSCLLLVLVILAGCSHFKRDKRAGERIYRARCAGCHGTDGFGNPNAGIDVTLASYGDPQLVALIREGMPERGMPRTNLTDAEAAELVPFLRNITARAQRPLPKITVTMVSGTKLEGEILNRGPDDLQLRTDEGRIHLLRRRDDRYREVTSDGEWPGYNSSPEGNRYTELTQINKENAARLGLAWSFALPGAYSLETTPTVVGGIMYVTGPNECFALDAGSGRPVWHYRRPHTRGGVPEAVWEVNRGVAVAGNRVFMVTGPAHLIALNRESGAFIWESEIADYRKNYYATSAPLVAGNLVVSGVAGGDEGAPGILAAFDQATGKEVWRFRTVPGPGDPASKTWAGKSMEHGGAPTWLTGSYDPEMDTIFWPTGNPGPDHDGDRRPGDNLYSDCVLALEAKTGKLKWYFQFTPHDVWDWDATETPILVNATWQAMPRKLLLQADRNGFFYVLDRTDGKMLLASRFARNLTWARGIQSNGRPILAPQQVPTIQGARVCPAESGATNWISPSFLPRAGLFYVQAFEACGVFQKSQSYEWKPGADYFAGSVKADPGVEPRVVLKAIDFQTGEIRWEVSEQGPLKSWGGTLATATGLVVFGEAAGKLMVVDALTGKLRWSYPAGEVWRASPMAYSFDGQEYFAMAAGNKILSFKIRE